MLKLLSLSRKGEPGRIGPMQRSMSIIRTFLGVFVKPIRRRDPHISRAHPEFELLDLRETQVILICAVLIDVVISLLSSVKEVRRP
jgi:hypothetical protein